MIVKKCLVCSNSFSSASNGSKYCLGCKTKICITCKKPFIVDRPSQKNERANRLKYCSKVCFSQRNGKRMEKECKTCYKQFSVPPSCKIGNYCSYSCAGKKKKPWLITVEQFLICKQCSKTFFNKAHEPNVKFCSKICYSLFQTGKPNGLKGRPAPWAIGNKYAVGKPAWNKGIKTGITPWLGKQRSQATKDKISVSRKGKYPDEKHPRWKGDNVGYDGLHRWINKKLGKPSLCEHCGKDGFKGKQIHWANKSQEYKRDLTDWLRLCASCHKLYDIHFVKL